MLTDIFAYRCKAVPIWKAYTTAESRLLHQGFGIVKDAIPYYNHEGEELDAGKARWELVHNQLARELGVKQLGTRWYSYQTKHMGNEYTNSGWYSWVHTCEEFVTSPPPQTGILTLISGSKND